MLGQLELAPYTLAYAEDLNTLLHEALLSRSWRAYIVVHVNTRALQQEFLHGVYVSGMGDEEFKRVYYCSHVWRASGVGD